MNHKHSFPFPAYLSRRDRSSERGRLISPLHPSDLVLK